MKHLAMCVGAGILPSLMLHVFMIIAVPPHIVFRTYMCMSILGMAFLIGRIP